VSRSWRIVREEREVREFLLANAAWEGTFAAARTFVVLYVVDGLGQSKVVSSIALGAVAAGYVVAAIVAGPLGDRFGLGRVIFFASFVYGGGLLLGGTAITWHWWFLGVVAAASLGNLVGSLVAYLLVRRYGEPLILGPGRRVGLTPGHLRLANRLFDRWGLFAVFFGRLLPVVRTYISFPAGLSRRIRLVPFVVATTLGAIPWNFALAFAGLKLGQNYERVAGAIGPSTIPLIIIVILLVLAAYYYGRRMGEEEEPTAAAR